MRIKEGDSAVFESHYDWPHSLSLGAAAAGTGMWIRGVPSGSFGDLSESLRDKFGTAGGVDRSLLQADGFFKESVPYPVRNLGENAVIDFVEGKDASHILAQSKHPSVAAENDNIIWEESSINRARGAEDMSSYDRFLAQSSNGFDAVEIVFRECLYGAGMTALYAMLMEAPIATIENVIHYRKGHKTGTRAFSDAMGSIIRKSAMGATIGFAMTAAVAAGAGPMLVTIAPVLSSVGLALYGIGALNRIVRASQDGVPLDQVDLLFCSGRCHTKFADEVSTSALIRWERDRLHSRP